MKTFSYTLLLAASALVALGSCKEKKQTGDIIVKKVETPKPKAPIRMQEYTSRSEAVAWLGRDYRVEIVRQPADSLPMVSDAIGQKYVDNRIRLRIVRPDGSVFKEKVFVKSSFASLLDDDYRSGGILEALVLDRVEGAEMRFAASVCKPQSDDEFIPLLVIVNSSGDVAFKRDTAIDTFGDGGADEDEEALGV